MFRAVPIQPWVKGALDVTINFLALDSVNGHLEVDFSPHLKMAGSFKSSNPGSIILNGGKLPQSLLHKVCVKQVYFIQPGTTRVRWYDENDEGSLISAEVLCLDWATCQEFRLFKPFRLSLFRTQDSFHTNTHSRHDITQISRTTELMVLCNAMRKTSLTNNPTLVNILKPWHIFRALELIVYPDRAEFVLESTPSH